MRPKQGNIRLHRLSRPVGQAVRSYATADGVFVISLHSRSQHASKDAWGVTHQPSGATSRFWSYGDCLRLIEQLRSKPRSEKDRWVILPRMLPMGGQVLFDRASGRWWPREEGKPVERGELEVMSRVRPITDFQMAFLDQHDDPHQKHPRTEKLQGRHIGSRRPR